MIRIKRVYEKPAKDDGCRILIDRLWPRGLKKEDVHEDYWLKEIAPSNDLRTWFGHDPKKWAEFRRRYRAELQHNDDAVAKLKDICRKEKTVTLLYGAKDELHNQAVVIKEFIHLD